MPTGARDVVTAYFDALTRRDVDAAAACWAPEGVDTIVGQSVVRGPDGVRTFFSELFAAVPDYAFAVETIVAEGEHVAVRWNATGTFSGETPFQGIAPTGNRVNLSGLDLLQVRDGQIVHNDAFQDGMGFARQLGMLPPQGSGAETAMLRGFNAKTRAERRLAGTAAEPVADGVWRIRGGIPRSMNVYLIEDDGGGVTVFDAGVKTMVTAVASAGARLGGINRVVLGHGHPDHRGAAAGLGAPVYCHPAEREETEGDGGRSYVDFSMLRPYARRMFPHLLDFWDGGPVRVAGTIEEGEDVSGFRVVHMPGHAPGMIALYRERDGLALSSDCFYTLDPQSGIHGAPRLPHPAFNLDTEQARASIRKLAALAPSAAWPGHAEPLTGDVAVQLERAAATP